MKRFINFITIGIFILLTFTTNGAPPPSTPPTGMTITGSNVIDMYISPYEFYAVNVEPFGADASVNWYSNNTTVGIINYSGLFTPINTGNVTIIAISTLNSSVTSSLDITVTSSAPTPSITGISTTVGLSGAELTIDGTNFTPSSIVYFGTTSVPYKSQTPNQITVTIPSLETDFYTLNVRNPGVSSNDFSFQIINPRVVDIFPTKANPGQVINLRGNDLNYVTEILFGGGNPGTILGVSFTGALLQVKIPDNSYSSPLELRTQIPGYSRLTEQVFIYERVTNAPVFTISPLEAVPGQTLTLIGSGFATSYLQNVVRFKNNVLIPVSGNTNMLIVPVPTVSGNGVIEVTNLQNSLTGISLNTFSPIGSSVLALNVSSFSTSGVFLNSNSISEIRYTDFNNDGRPDLFMGSSSISYIIRNTDSNGGLNFDIKSVLPNNLQNFSFGDITGDGLMDIIAIDPQGFDWYVTCFKNTFSGGDITFERYFTFVGPNFVRKSALKDLNGDGKLDIIIWTSDGTPSVHIYVQNPTNPLIYDPTPVIAYPELVDIGFEDLNGDGLPELIGIESVFGDVSYDRVFVKWNYSTSDYIRFSQDPISIGQLPIASNGNLDFQNLDKDADIDISVTYDNGLTVFYNNSELGRLYFGQNVVYDHSNFSNPLYNYLTDFNGDGITDIATIRNDGSFQLMDFYIGRSASPLEFYPPFGVNYLGTGTGFAFRYLPIDINMDGKMDLLANSLNSDFFFLINNAPKFTPPQIVNILPQRGFSNATVTISGTGLSNATAVEFGGRIIPFTLVNDNNLIARLEASLTFTGNQFKVYNAAGPSNASTAFTIVNGFDPDSLIVVVLGDGNKSATDPYGLPVQLQQFDRSTNSPELTFAFDTLFRLPVSDIRYGALTNSDLSADLALASLIPYPGSAPDYTDSLVNYQSNVIRFPSTFNPGDFYNTYAYARVKPLPYAVITNPADIREVYASKPFRQIQYFNTVSQNLVPISQGITSGTSRLRIFNNNLYASVPNLGICQIGNGLPNSSTSITGIILTTSLGYPGTSDPVDFFISSSYSFALVCDARSGAFGGGVYLFTNSGTNWNMVYRLQPDTDGAGHIYVDQKSNPLKVYFATSAFTQNAIYKFLLDTTVLSNIPVPQLVMRASENMAYRGIALSPNSRRQTNSVSIPLESIQIMADSFAIRTPSGRLPLSIRYTPDNATPKGVFWFSSDTNIAKVDSLGVVMAKSNGQVSIQAVYKFNRSISDNVVVTISGQFVPLISISIRPENDLNILSFATEKVPVNVTYTPVDATIKKINWTLTQSLPNLITIADSLQGMISINSGRNENGIVTLTGTSAQGDTIKSSWVFTVVGKILKDASKTVQSRPISDASGIIQANPCLATMELFIQDDNYIDFQWYFVNNNNDTLKILGEKTYVYKPVFEGRYFVRAVRTDATIEYVAFPVQLPNFNPPLMKQLKDANMQDTMLICSAPSVRTQWYVNNRFIVGQNDSTLRLWYNGTYHAVAKYANGCKQRTENIVIYRPDFIDILQSRLRFTDTTIENYFKLHSQPRVRVHPNPVKDELKFEYLSSLGVTAQVTIYNCMGRQVLTALCKPENGSIHTLDIYNLPRGIFTLQIVEKDKVVYTKFIKE